MPQKQPSPEKSRKQEPQSYMVRFVCEFILEGDIFVTAKKADAAKAAREHLSTLDYKAVDELALFRKTKIKTSRVISEQAVRKTLATKVRGEDPGTPPVFAPTRKTS